MGWIIALLVAILGALVAIGIIVAVNAEAVLKQLARLRLEVGTGLGVNVEHPQGYLDGSHLEALRNDMREQRKKERKERYERDAQF